MAKGLRGRNCPPSEGQHAMRSLGSHGTQGLLSARGAALTLVGVWGFEWSPNGVWMGWSEAALADTPCWQLHQNLPMGDVFHDGSYSLCGLDFGMCIFLSLLIITLHCKVQATSSSAAYLTQQEYLAQELLVVFWILLWILVWGVSHSRGFCSSEKKQNVSHFQASVSMHFILNKAAGEAELFHSSPSSKVWSVFPGKLVNSVFKYWLKAFNLETFTPVVKDTGIEISMETFLIEPWGFIVPRTHQPSLQTSA